MYMFSQVACISKYTEVVKWDQKVSDGGKIVKKRMVEVDISFCRDKKGIYCFVFMLETVE